MTAGIAAGSNFATKADYGRLEQSVNMMNAATTELRTRFDVMLEQNKVNERQDVLLRDYEQRLRDLERAGRSPVR